MATTGAKSLRRVGFYCAACCIVLVLSSAPNWLLLYHEPDGQHLHWLLASLAFAGAVIAACRHRLSLAIFTFPCVVLVVPTLMFITNYNEFPTANVAAILSQATPSDAGDFMVGRWTPLLSSYAVVFATWGLAVWLAGATRPVERTRFESAVVVFARSCLAVVAGVIVGAGLIYLEGLQWSRKQTIIETSNGLKQLPFHVEKLESVFPVGIPISVLDYRIGENSRSEHRKVLAAFGFGAKPPPPTQQRQIYVLVIGESSRADRWSLGGYQRDTNPLLRSEKNLFFFGDMVTPWTFTLASVPVIASRKPGTDRRRTFDEKSVVSLFKEAGFRTYWLSNQGLPAGVGSEIGDISDEADERRWLNLSERDYAREGTLDGVQLPAFDRVLSHPEQKQFIVVHLMGSHDAYRFRYPKAFNRFHPSLTDYPSADDHDPANKILIANSYDNSILYTDFVIDSLIGKIKATGAVSALVYTSDHGEALYDNACKFIGHGGTAHENYTVSAFGWLSDAYTKIYPTVLSTIEENRNKRLSTENIFHMLADLSHIDYRGSDPSKSPFNGAFRERPRDVNVGPRSVEWDTASFRPPCGDPIARPMTAERSILGTQHSVAK